LGFDLIVLFNDSYFMPLVFLLSGLFGWPGLTRKGSLVYLRERLLRLGLPFAVAVVSVNPLAYYPSYRMTGATAGFGEFWTGMILRGPWPSGNCQSNVGVCRGAAAELGMHHRFATYAGCGARHLIVPRPVPLGITRGKGYTQAA
jgi:hypothetical protein